MSDNVKHPSHYCKGGIECIEAIKSALSNIADPFEAYCTGNIIKYVWRWNDKNGIEDLHKAIQYIDFIEQHRASFYTPIATITAHKPTQAEYEELFDEDKPTVSKTESVEPVKGKYDGLSIDKLFDELCPRSCDSCPIGNLAKGDSCLNYAKKNPITFTAIAIEYLEGLEGKA